jgi:hypothetical protein
MKRFIVFSYRFNAERRLNVKIGESVEQAIPWRFDILGGPNLLRDAQKSFASPAQQERKRKIRGLVALRLRKSQCLQVTKYFSRDLYNENSGVL